MRETKKDIWCWVIGTIDAYLINKRPLQEILNELDKKYKIQRRK
jgi:hypothetical protein